MRCHSGVTGLPLDHAATGYLLSPDGRPIVAMCDEHAEEVMAEYERELGERWSFQPVEAPGYRYRMKNTGHSSTRFGDCQLCGKHVSEVHYQTEQRRYDRGDGTTGYTTRGCRAIYGHAECLRRYRHGTAARVPAALALGRTVAS